MRSSTQPFDALFALLLPRDAARFDAVDDLRRAFPPDDFNADAMINFLEEGTRQQCARFARNVEPDERQKSRVGAISRFVEPNRVEVQRRGSRRRITVSCGFNCGARVSTASQRTRSLTPINSRRVCARMRSDTRGLRSHSDRRRFHHGAGVSGILRKELECVDPSTTCEIPSRHGTGCDGIDSDDQWCLVGSAVCACGLQAALQSQRRGMSRSCAAVHGG